MNELNIDAVVKPLLEDELQEIQADERVLYTLTNEQIEAYLEYAALYNTAGRLKRAAKNLEKKASALKTLFWMDIKDSSELAERSDNEDDQSIRVRSEDKIPVIVTGPEHNHGIPDFLKRLLE